MRNPLETTGFASAWPRLTAQSPGTSRRHCEATGHVVPLVRELIAQLVLERPGLGIQARAASATGILMGFSWKKLNRLGGLKVGSFFWTQQLILEHRARGASRELRDVAEACVYLGEICVLDECVP